MILGAPRTVKFPLLFDDEGTKIILTQIRMSILLIPRSLAVDHCYFHPTLQEADAEKFFEQSVTEEARLNLYDSAVKRYKDEIDSAALGRIQDEMREQVRQEVVAEYEGEMKARFEQQLTNDVKAAMKKEVQEEYEAMLSRMRSGLA